MSDFEIKDGVAIIKEGTRVIEANDLSGHTSIESVVIPKGVTKIEDYAFGGCTSLTTVILPFSVNKIGKDTFKECSALTTIYVPADKVDHYKKCLPVDLHGKIAPAGDMKWDEAIREVLADNGAPMRLVEILKKIIEHGYRLEYGDTPVNSVGTILRINEKRWFECVERGVYKLVDTSVTDEFDWDEFDWDDDDDKKDDDPNYKKASDFITSEVPSKDEKELLELIVKFRLNDKVCFADILGNLNVEFSDKIDNDAIRHQSIDRTLLENKLDELKVRIAEIEEETRYDHRLTNSYGPFLNSMKPVADAINALLDVSGDIVVVDVPVLGEFVPGNNPKVVIYYKNIENNIKIYESRRQVMAGVFVHEMFHAWNYFKAGKMSRSVMESRIKTIDEPMVEFETLYFLKELEAYTGSKIVLSARELRVKNKQLAIGDVAAYGFGYYLFKNLSDGDSIKWIETYSEKSAFIDGSNSNVKNAENALIPIYPFMSEAEVMKWFKKIIFDGYATSVTVGKSASAKTGLDVSLRDLVLACIKTIGRKCFEAKELYAFAPIFKLCAAVSGDLEDALKQQLDELVKEGVIEALSHDCYVVK